MELAVMGRPAREATPEQRAEIERLGRKAGASAVAARTGLPRRLVEREMAAAGIRRRVGFSLAEDDYLRAHAGEMAPKRLQRELRERFGREWPLNRISERAAVLMGLGIREMRRELTVTQVRLLIGRSEAHIEREIERKRLKAHRADGRWWSIEPSHLRRYIVADYARVNWLLCEHGEVIGLLRGLWGMSEDERRGKRGGA